MRKLILLIIYLVLRPFESLILSRKGIVNIYTHGLDYDSLPRFLRVMNKLGRHASLISIRNSLQLETIDESYYTISTDDGLQSNVIIDKALKSFGVELTAFINSAFIGKENDQEAFEAYRMDLGEDFLEDLGLLENTVFANHGAKHLEISELNTDQIIEEILNGDMTRLGYNVPFLRVYSWPFGEMRHGNSRLKEICDEIGYTFIFSAIRGNMIKKPSSYKFIYRDHIKFSWSYNEIMGLMYITKLFKCV